MNPQERAVIDGIFERLRTVADQPRDPEVEQYIAERVRQQPYAPYALAQSTYVQEQALLNQQREIEQLQAEITRLSQPQPAPQGGGFLSGLFGGGSSPPRQEPPAYGQRGTAMPAAPQPMAPMAPSPGPWGQQPQQQQGGPWAQQAAPQRQGMGFLGTAAAAAAGVAGGMMVGSLLSNAFGGGHAQAGQNGFGLGGMNSGGTNQNGMSQEAQGTAPELQDEDDSYDTDTGDFGDDGGSESYDA
jgi:uncharacterized protein